MSEPNPLDHIGTGIADPLLDDVGTVASLGPDIVAALDEYAERHWPRHQLPPVTVVTRAQVEAHAANPMSWWTEFLDRMPYVLAARAALARWGVEQVTEITGGFPPPRCALGQATDDPCDQMAFEAVRSWPADSPMPADLPRIPMCIEHADLCEFANRGEGHQFERRSYTVGPGLTAAELAAEPAT